MDTIEKECAALDGAFDGKKAVSGETNYQVKGTFMDSNGCLKTYGDGYEESFISDTNYY